MTDGLKPPWWQRTLKLLGWLFAGAGFFNLVLEMLGNAMALVTPNVAKWITVAVFGSMAAAQVLMRRWPVPWVHSGVRVLYRNPGLGLWAGAAGIVVLAWTPSLVNHGAIEPTERTSFTADAGIFSAKTWIDLETQGRIDTERRMVAAAKNSKSGEAIAKDDYLCEIVVEGQPAIRRTQPANLSEPVSSIAACEMIAIGICEQIVHMRPDHCCTATWVARIPGQPSGFEAVTKRCGKSVGPDGGAD